jgi:hypothetical protein
MVTFADMIARCIDNDINYYINYGDMFHSRALKLTFGVRLAEGHDICPRHRSSLAMIHEYANIYIRVAVKHTLGIQIQIWKVTFIDRYIHIVNCNTI